MWGNWLKADQLWRSSVTSLMCVSHGGGWWVVFWRDLKLATRRTASGTSWGSTLRSPTTFSLTGGTQHELQSDLQMAATCAGLGGVQAANQVQLPLVLDLWPLSKRYKADASCLEFVNHWAVLGKSQEWNFWQLLRKGVKYGSEVAESRPLKLSDSATFVYKWKNWGLP